MMRNSSEMEASCPGYNSDTPVLPESGSVWVLSEVFVCTLIHMCVCQCINMCTYVTYIITELI